MVLSCQSFMTSLMKKSNPENEMLDSRSAIVYIGKMQIIPFKQEILYLQKR